MSRKVFTAVSLFVFYGLFFYGKVLAWNEEFTHRDLSEYATESSKISKDKGNYLKNLGITNALDEYLTWGSERYKIRKWLRNGAFFEDKSSFGFPIWHGSTTRSFNHFHNPLKTWSEAGG